MSQTQTKKRLDDPPKRIKFKIQRRDNEGASAALGDVRDAVPPQSERHLGADGDPQKSGDGRGQTDHAAGLGHELSRTGLRHLHDGHRRTVRQSCSALIDDLLLASGGDTVTLEPMSKFPNVRDLKVDRSKMFDHLKQVHAWIELDGTYDLGPGPHISNETAQERYAYSRCMTCGCCLEACPQYGDDNYIGPQAIAQAGFSTCIRPARSPPKTA